MNFLYFCAWSEAVEAMCTYICKSVNITISLDVLQGYKTKYMWQNVNKD